MSQLSDLRHQNISKKLPSIKGTGRSLILILQKRFKLFPREICLISGAPRSGTSAVCEWLGYHQDISGFEESRILVSIHSFIKQINRFQILEENNAFLANQARKLVIDYYSSSRIFIGKRLLIDKEPLEPIAFPSKDYDDFISNIRMLFPKSKLLFAIRDPLSTIWSMARRIWGTSLTNMENKNFTIDEYVENWCACADLVLKYKPDPNSYIVQFGRLVSDPENESRRIFNFLDVRDGNIFQPRPTKEIGFSNDEKEKILRMVRPQLELLSAHGISDLS